jgi:hypothetical protein
MHGDTAYGSFVRESPPRPDARPGAAVIFAAHDALTDGPDNNRYIFHSASDDLNVSNGLND